MKRLLITILLTIGTVVPAFALSAVPASAAGCWADGCTGQDPVAQGCDSAPSTLESVQAPGGGPYVDLRYSPADCDAAWAREAGDNVFMVQGSTTPDSSNIVVTYYGSGGGGNISFRWTDMVGFNLWTRACIRGYVSDDWNCTGWH